MFRCTKMSPGASFVRTVSGTLESEQPSQSIFDNEGHKCNEQSYDSLAYGSNLGFLTQCTLRKEVRGVWVVSYIIGPSLVTVEKELGHIHRIAGSHL